MVPSGQRSEQWQGLQELDLFRCLRSKCFPRHCRAEVLAGAAASPLSSVSTQHYHRFVLTVLVEALVQARMASFSFALAFGVSQLASQLAYQLAPVGAAQNLSPAIASLSQSHWSWCVAAP